MAPITALTFDVSNKHTGPRKSNVQTQPGVLQQLQQSWSDVHQDVAEKQLRFQQAREVVQRKAPTVKRKRPLFLSAIPGKGPSDAILIAPLVFQETATNVGYGLVAFVCDMLGDTPARRWFTNEAHVRSANIQEVWDRETHRVRSVLTDDCDRLATEHDWIRGDDPLNICL